MLHVDVVKRLRDFSLELSLTIESGVTLVIGPSGSGKSTLLRLVAGLLRPDSGRITLDGRVLSDATTFVPPFRREIGVVFQEYALFPHLSVAENVAFGLRARHVGAAERAQRTQHLLDRFEIGRLGRERVTELSGGQRQRVALARALAIEPQALLLDEPLAALDPLTRETVRRELHAILADVRLPTLLVSHDPDDARIFPDRSIAIERGVLTPGRVHAKHVG